MSSARSKRVSLVAFSTAFVCASTMAFQVYIPATRGYFNVGEVAVYLVALTLGPRIGAFAGGVGSMLADVFTGYYHFAPATLLIKACEGFIVGQLNSLRVLARSKWSKLCLNAGGSMLVGALIFTVGSKLYVGMAEVYVNLPALTPQYPWLSSFTLLSSTLEVPLFTWLGVALTVILIMGLTTALFKWELWWLITSVITGGLVMVLGYFLYETLIMGVAAAMVEVPFNIAQMLIGLAVAIPLYQAVKRPLQLQPSKQ